MLSKRIKFELTTGQAAAGFLLVGILVVIYGYATTQGAFEWVRLVEQVYSNFGIELVSIALTVLVIESLNQRRAERERVIREKEAKEQAENERKAELILQMGSPTNDIAIEAVRILQQKGWLYDESLRGAVLRSANLQGANLEKTNLQGADLMYANLQGAKLWEANLQGTVLIRTNLQGVNLMVANLREAKLWEANLQGASLNHANLQGAGLFSIIRDAEFDENTTLPDETKWTLDTDMTRFTDPDHPQFWRSDNLLSPAYGGE